MEKYLEILGLKTGASNDEIKQAYRDLVKVWHPDRFSNDPKLQKKAQEKLKEINEAYNVLKNYNSSQDYSGRSQSGKSSPREKPTENDYEARPSNNQSNAKSTSTPKPKRIQLGTSLKWTIGVISLVIIWGISNSINAPSKKYPNEISSPTLKSRISANSQNSKQMNSMPNIEKPSSLEKTQKATTDLRILADGQISKDINAIPKRQKPYPLEKKQKTTSDRKNLDLVESNKTSDTDLSSQKITLHEFSSFPKANEKPSENIAKMQNNVFTIGSSKDEVLAVQGTPTRLNDYIWSYEYSSVTFNNSGKVSGYSNNSNNLKIKLTPSSSQSLSYFTIGSSKDEVLAVQGTPTRLNDYIWSYEYSSVTFNNSGKVSGYSNNSNNLKIKLTPSSSQSLSYFTIGSSKDEVLAVQGTPTRLNDYIWSYEYSSVTFNNSGKVSGYSNNSNNLKIKLRK